MEPFNKKIDLLPPHNFIVDFFNFISFFQLCWSLSLFYTSNLKSTTNQLISETTIANFWKSTVSDFTLENCKMILALIFKLFYFKEIKNKIKLRNKYLFLKCFEFPNLKYLNKDKTVTAKLAFLAYISINKIS